MIVPCHLFIVYHFSTLRPTVVETWAENNNKQEGIEILFCLFFSSWNCPDSHGILHLGQGGNPDGLVAVETLLSRPKAHLSLFSK